MAVRAAPLGGASRADLFGGGPTAAAYESARQRSAPSSARDVLSSQPAADEVEIDQGPLQLEHVLGFTGRYRRTALAHPRDPSLLLRASGPVLVVAHLSDPHAQSLLRGHDEEVSALAVNGDGTLAATGQVGSTRRKGYPAPVILWDVAGRRRVRTLEGLTEAVKCLDFSPDGRLLCGAGADAVMYVWDIATGEVVFGKRFPKPFSLFIWYNGVVSPASTRQQEQQGQRQRERHSGGGTPSPSYRAVYCMAAEVLSAELCFDSARRQWQLNSSPLALPSSGLPREYTCALVRQTSGADGGYGGEELLCGTLQGELAVFRLSNNKNDLSNNNHARSGGIYRASVPVGCGGGLLSICLDQATGAVVCGGGDGSVVKLEGSDVRWRRVGTISAPRNGSGAAVFGSPQNLPPGGRRGDSGFSTCNGNGNGSGVSCILDGAVIALSATADGAEVLAATVAGSVFRLLLEDLTALKVSSAHTAAVTAVACCPRIATAVATADAAGKVRFFDLSNYSVTAAAPAGTLAPGGGDSGRGSSGGAGGGGGSSSGPSGGGGSGGNGGALCLCWAGEGRVISGRADAVVRCLDAGNGSELWRIPGAHRTAVTAVAARSDAAAAFLISGAADGSVRVWSLRTRALLLQFCEHRAAVAAVLPDVAAPHLVHTAGRDAALYTYDLRTERRTPGGAHLAPGGRCQLTAATQRRDGEREVITADSTGRLLWFDCDAKDPVRQRHPQRTDGAPMVALRAAAVSPCGRFLAVCGNSAIIEVFDAAGGSGGSGGGAMAVGAAAHAAAATSLQWTADGRQIVSGGEDCMLCVWNFFTPY